MKKPAIVLAAILVATSLACASRPTPVPVIGLGSDVSALVGKWTGEYSSPETGRTGSIDFSLQAGKDTAFGNVVMIARPQTEPGVAMDHPAVSSVAGRSTSETIMIRFVRLEGSQVLGRLDPYRDPDCGCQLTTTFRGAFTDSRTIEGTFDTVGSGFGHLPASGRWRVTREIQ
jgi:hypothetical protein